VCFFLSCRPESTPVSFSTCVFMFPSFRRPLYPKAMLLHFFPHISELLILAPFPALSRDAGLCSDHFPLALSFITLFAVMSLFLSCVSHCLSVASGPPSRLRRAFFSVLRFAPRIPFHIALGHLCFLVPLNQGTSLPPPKLKFLLIGPFFSTSDPFALFYDGMDTFRDLYFFCYHG